MKSKVYENTSIVTGLSVAERGLGFLYRVVLSRLLGAEGLGLYQVALSLFSLFLTLGTGGIPITVSRMISKSKAEKDCFGERASVSAGMALAILLTLPVCLLFWGLGEKVNFLFSDGRCLSVFLILLAGLTFSSVYAVIRGHFWGNKQFLAPSVLELAEETVMVIAGVLLLQKAPTPFVGAQKAAWAAVISYAFSFTASLIWFFVCGGKLSSPKKHLKPLFNAVLPITSVRASGSLVNSAIAVLLPAMLVRAGFGESDALKLFGVVTGMVMPILFIPSTLIGSLSLVLVPELSEDFYRNRLKRLRANLERGLRASLYVACALIPFFYAFGKDLGCIAFSDVTAGEMIRKSCVVLLPMSITMITTSMLNSMGFEKQTFLFYFIGAAAMLLCVLFLPAVCGVYAYVIGLGSSFLINAVCNLFLLWKNGFIFQKHGGQVRLERYFIPLIAALPLALIGQFLHTLFKTFSGELFSLILATLALALLTAVFYVLTGLLPLKEWLRNSRKNKQQEQNGKF